MYCPSLIVLSKSNTQAGAVSRDFVLVEWGQYPTIKGLYNGYLSMMRTISVNFITVSWSIGCNENISLMSFAILLNYVLWMKEIVNYLRLV